LREIANRIVRPARQSVSRTFQSEITLFREYIMRNRLFLLAAAVLLSACADDQHTTAPASRSGLSGRSLNGEATASGKAIANPLAKPTDQVGFTQVFTVGEPDFTHISKGNTGTGTATCPAGSHVIGGYYTITFHDTAPDFTYISAGIDQANGWSVTGSVPATAVSAVVTIAVAAVCIQ
jgi:hypothetical protein